MSPRKRVLTEENLGQMNPKRSRQDFETDFDSDMFLDDEFLGSLNFQNIESDQNTEKSSRWYRCSVSNIKRDEKNYDLIIQLTEKGNFNKLITCYLQDSWKQTKIETGDIVSVYPVWNTIKNSFIVNNKEGYIVTNPDNLISSTTIANSLFCQRKAVLQEKFKGFDSGNKYMLIGTIVHQLTQTALQKKIYSIENITKLLTTMVQSKEFLSMLYSADMTILETINDIHSYIPIISKFIQNYIEKGISVKSQNQSSQIEDIRDIEENVYVPHLGLKGKIDISVKMHRISSIKTKENFIAPLEIKTGKSSFSLEHKAQVNLYQLMLQELGLNTDSGFLLYLKSGDLKEIFAKRNELSDLIIMRNELSFYFKKSLNFNDSNFENMQIILPEPIHHHACSKCSYSNICVTFLKLEKLDNHLTYEPFKVISNELDQYLDQSHYDYILFWYKIIWLEQEASKKLSTTKLLWTKSPEERALTQNTLANLKIFDFIEESFDSFICKLKYNADNNCISENQYNFLNHGLIIGDQVIISTKKQINIAVGTIKEINKQVLHVVFTKNFLQNHQNQIFFIDKYEMVFENMLSFTNLSIFLENNDKAEFLRQTIINKREVSFSTKLPSFIAKEGRSILQPLNKLQQKAILKALSTDSFMLIKGLPGTGKTETLVSLIRLCYLSKKSVLITSHTHSAIDNILLRLVKYQIPFLRLGSDHRIHSDLISYSESTLTESCKTPEDLQKVYKSFTIIAVTCYGASHTMFTKLNNDFDFCIVDEATQVFEPTVVRPLLYAKKFILIGDPNQLPPLIRSDDARNLGGDKSLFHRLDSINNTISLTIQYRMNRTITKLANEITYNNELICGNDKIGLACIEFPNYSQLLDRYKNQKWILKSLEKHIDQSVMFLDTKDCYLRSNKFKNIIEDYEEEKENFENDNGNVKQQQQSSVNFCEAAIVFILINSLLQAGYNCENIGVISPYRAQVKLLNEFKLKMKKSKSKESVEIDKLEINTVDQYQGRDKSIIIYSCTKTGGNKLSQSSSDILENKNRLTVAITRSKHKLIIIGDQNCLKNYDLFSLLLNKIPDRCKIDLEEGKNNFNWNYVLEESKNILKESCL